MRIRKEFIVIRICDEPSSSKNYRGIRKISRFQDARAWFV